MTTPKALPDRARVVIVGGGVIGISIAFHLAEAGVTDLFLLEARALGARLITNTPVTGVTADPSSALCSRPASSSARAPGREPSHPAPGRLGSCSPGCPTFTTTRTSDDRRGCALPQESAVQRCDPQQLEQHRARRDHAERTAGPLCITGHLQQGTKAARIAELQRGEVDNYRPAVMVDDPGDVPERRVGGSNVQFATDACDGFAGRFDSVAQLKRRGSAPILAFRHDDYLLGF